MSKIRFHRLLIPATIPKAILVVAILLFSILPIYNAVIVSLTPYSNMLEPMLFPRFYHFENFLTTFKIIYRQMINSFLYSITTVVIDLAIAIPVAYVIARFKFRGRQVVMFSLLFTQMLSGIVLMPSVYTIFARLKLTNMVFGLLLMYVGVNLALCIWLLVGFFSSIPKEVEEAAIIDGTGKFQLLYGVVVPMIKPGVAVSAIFIFINTYNEFVIPLFLLTNSKLHTITLTLNSLMTATTIEWQNLAAGSLIGMIPPMIAFIFFQKDIIEGTIAGAVKG